MQPAYTMSNDISRYDNLTVHHEADGQALWFGMNVQPRPCFTWGLIRDILTFQENFKAKLHTGSVSPRCLVFSSEHPGLFSLGGDLQLFRSVIERKDRKMLTDYAEDCVSVVHNHLTMPGVVTVTVMEGDALGAGLESALSSDVVIAERGTHAGLPEVLFNLVPGHGAFYFLERRIGFRAAEKMIQEGRIYSMEELHQMGVVDILVDRGNGRQAMRELLNQRSWNAFQALQHIKRHHSPITREALAASARIWVDAAMQLTERNLKMMERLIRAQEKRVGMAAAPEAPADEREMLPTARIVQMPAALATV